MKKRFPALCVKDLERALERIAPAELAEEWDNVGLLIGDPAAKVERALVALEITRPVLREAARRRVQAIVTHHPLIFRPLSRVVASDVTGRLALEVARIGAAALAAHTNLDHAPEGTNLALAELAGLRESEILRPLALEDRVKFVVFVPRGYEEKIIAAVARAGAGVIGAYSHCTFRSAGTGTYLPLRGARPFAGEIGRLEQAEEWRLECEAPRARLDRLVAEVRAAHPYEEMAFDVFPLLDARARYGLGRVGELPRPVTLKAFAARLRRALGGAAFQRVGGEPAAVIRRVAVISGSPGKLLRSLAPDCADVLVTGELDHHDALEALERGLTVLRIGHFESERIVVPRLARLLREDEEIARCGLEILESRAEASPFSPA